MPQFRITPFAAGLLERAAANIGDIQQRKAELPLLAMRMRAGALQEAAQKEELQGAKLLNLSRRNALANVIRQNEIVDWIGKYRGQEIDLPTFQSGLQEKLRGFGGDTDANKILAGAAFQATLKDPSVRKPDGSIDKELVRNRSLELYGLFGGQMRPYINEMEPEKPTTSTPTGIKTQAEHLSDQRINRIIRDYQSGKIKREDALTALDREIPYNREDVAAARRIIAPSGGQGLTAKQLTDYAIRSSQDKMQANDRIVSRADSYENAVNTGKKWVVSDQEFQEALDAGDDISQLLKRLQYNKVMLDREQALKGNAWENYRVSLLRRKPAYERRKIQELVTKHGLEYNDVASAIVDILSSDPDIDPNNLQPEDIDSAFVSLKDRLLSLEAGE
jgi:hypothetical protein